MGTSTHLENPTEADRGGKFRKTHRDSNVRGKPGAAARAAPLPRQEEATCVGEARPIDRLHKPVSFPPLKVFIPMGSHVKVLSHAASTASSPP